MNLFKLRRRFFKAVPPVLALAVMLATGAGQVRAQQMAAFNPAQQWRLDDEQSKLFFQSVKKGTVTETHAMRHLDGELSRTGDAVVTIDLDSLDSGVDIRNVRMRFLLFETFKFPEAVVRAKIDMASLSALRRQGSMIVNLPLTLQLHGVVRKLRTPVIVSSRSGDTVSVASAAPIHIKAADFGLSEGVLKLAEAVGGLKIEPSSQVTFDLVFTAAKANPAAVRRQQVAARTRTAARKAPIDLEACRNRLIALSEANAVYFNTGKARLQGQSRPLLDKVAEIAKRCPKVVIKVEGHTDSDGAGNANMRLSRARAASVVAYLLRGGIGIRQLRSVGYGESRPVAPNNTARNKARNRRIEFKVQ